MTSPVRISQRRRGAWERPFTEGELDHVCKDPKFLELMAGARSFIELLPEPIPGRHLAETLRRLAVCLGKAGIALRDLPSEARARLYGVSGGGLPAINGDCTKAMLTEDLALQLALTATVARTAAARVRKSAGRPSDYRRFEAISRAQKLCERFNLPAGEAVEVASIILGEDLSADAFKRAAKHIKRKPT